MKHAREGYWTVIIPPVPREYRTEWHPTPPGEPRPAGAITLDGSLTRGAFDTDREAIAWAASHLNGTPYRLKWVQSWEWVQS